jgi:hypothetical protein
MMQSGEDWWILPFCRSTEGDLVADPLHLLSLSSDRTTSPPSTHTIPVVSLDVVSLATSLVNTFHQLHSVPLSSIRCWLAG